MRIFRLALVACLASWVVVGCADDSQDGAAAGGGSTGTGGTTSGGGGAGGTGGTGGSGGVPVDPTCNGDISSPLSALPELSGVKAWVRGNGMRVAFEPVAGARDYRLYALPVPSAVSTDPDGSVHVADATYRCAGDREAPYVELNGAGPAGWVSTLTEGDVRGYTREASTAELGHVYAVAGTGRVPVYALGSSAPEADGQCYEERWGATRLTEYVADASERDALLAAGYRDDGVAFWIPESGGDRPVYTWEESTDGARLYFSDDGELAVRSGAAPAFDVLSAPSTDTVPLLRVFYDVGCGTAHDVLAAGEGRFERVLTQGNQPVWEIDWPDLEPSAVLVLEALSEPCPFQGHLSPQTLPAIGNAQPFVTVDDVRASAAHGEVFINGQHDPASIPAALKRSYVCVEPLAAETDWDFVDAFDGPSETPTEVDLVTFGGWNLYLENSQYDLSFHSIEPEAWAFGAVQGELWVAYADWASDTNGKVRITPKTKASLTDDAFVHASMEVDSWATGRRYPQLWISSQDVPVQDNMEQGVTLNLQTFSGWPSSLQLQLCDHQTWDVNAQCPVFQYEKESFDGEPWPPQPTVAEHGAVGHKRRFDLFLSTTRAYVLFDGLPYGCANIPAGVLAPGEVSVTYGDVLYHSGVDEPVVGTDYMPFHGDYMLTETRRHFDNLAFRSEAPAPEWDEDRFPCTSDSL